MPVSNRNGINRPWNISKTHCTRSNIITTYNYINLFYCLQGSCKVNIYAPCIEKSILSLTHNSKSIQYFDSLFDVQDVCVDELPIVKTINLETNMLLHLPFGCIYSFEFDETCLIISGFHTTLLNKLINKIKKNNDYIIKRG